MTPEQLKAKFPNASRSFIERNSSVAMKKASQLKQSNDHPIDHTIRPSQPEQMDRKEIREARPDEGVGKAARLVAVRVVFKAGHGQTLDHDNSGYSIAKPLGDALVNLGIIESDKDLRIEVEQRRDHHRT